MSRTHDIRLPRGVSATDTSLVLDGPLSEDGWEQLLEDLVRVHDRIPWWIGDAIAYGERRWGKTYARAAKATGLSAGTLRNYVLVSRHVAPEDRRPDLPWRAHYFVRRFPAEKQRTWLARAVEWRWTSGQLRDQIEAQADSRRPADGSFPKPALDTAHECPMCHYPIPCDMAVTA